MVGLEAEAALHLKRKAKKFEQMGHPISGSIVTELIH